MVYAKRSKLLAISCLWEVKVKLVRRYSLSSDRKVLLKEGRRPNKRVTLVDPTSGFLPGTMVAITSFLVNCKLESRVYTNWEDKSLVTI